MVIGTLELHLRLDGCFSLKDKRRVLRSLLEKARRDYHVAIAEVNDMDVWNSSVVGVACVSNDSSHADSILQHVLDMFDESPDASVEGAIKDVRREG
jgi:uncharacterized protein